MTHKELTEKIQSQIPATVLDRVVSPGLRRFLRVLFLLLVLVSFSFSLFQETRALSIIEGTLADGLTLLFFGIFLLLLQIEAFYNSKRFSKLKTRLKESGFEEGGGGDFAVAQILALSDDFDLTEGFLSSPISEILFARLDIGPDSRKHFLSGERKKLSESKIVFEDEFITFADYAGMIYENDEAFRVFVSSHSTNKEEYLGAALWISKNFESVEAGKRFWGRDRLESYPSLGTTWSYGFSYEIGKYGASLNTRVDLGQIDLADNYREAEAGKLENILARREEANAIIIDDEEPVAKAVLGRLLKKMKSGVSLAALEHKSIMELDWNILMADKKSKPELEAELLKIMKEARSAGNTIIYIPNFPEFQGSTKSIGVNVGSLFEEFLKSREIQVVVHATVADFHYFIETNPGLLSSFERIIPEKGDTSSFMPVIAEKAVSLEREWKIFFTYQALAEIGSAAENYITYGEMPGKALDLIIEIAPWAAREKTKIIRKPDVSAYVSLKTGIPTGAITKEEGDKLSKLEEILHQRIVGQEEAVVAVANALRRARSGIANSKRPLASFLFLGPTGVGKTETSKALAEVFFGDEENMIRMDMSEYNGADALPRLIGSFAEGRSGFLTSKLRDNPYGVLLLDEFEKSAPDVLDLFLQIIDEGIFSDSSGKPVNARNLIIIATSNAGSGMIWEMVRAGGSLAQNKDKIIDGIIKERTFRPELLNRFDGIILFKPLVGGELRSVAQILLAKFAKRLDEEKQIKLKVSGGLLDYLASEGADTQFGGRAINRAIQGKVEDLVAKKIISGELVAGSVLEIGRGDLVG